MSCLPLLSFSLSIPAVFRPHDTPLAPRLNGQQLQTPVMTPPPTPKEPDSPYDKLSQVSVSHRRVDSFEWVMTQSAPNTPPTLGGSNHESFSPPPARLIGSAPLPVPNETWLGISMPREVKGKRGYFDWWFSPSLSNDKGYARVSSIGESIEQDQPDLEGINHSLFESLSRTIAAQAQTGPALDNASTFYPPLTRLSASSPSEELNALGITFPDTPPPSPSTSKVSKRSQSYVPSRIAPGVSAPRLPKRVSFSPAIDEVTIEPWSEFESSGHQGMPWGNYLPSSFLVARPPLPRSTSLPAVRGKKNTVQPILRRSTSLNPDPSQESSLAVTKKQSTEMRSLSSKQCSQIPSSDMTQRSPIPAQRLTTRGPPSAEHGRWSVNRTEAD